MQMLLPLLLAILIRNALPGAKIRTFQVPVRLRRKTVLAHAINVVLTKHHQMNNYVMVFALILVAMSRTVVPAKTCAAQNKSVLMVNVLSLLHPRHQHLQVGGPFRLSRAYPARKRHRALHHIRA
jgi:hypothetical protein